MPKQGIVKTFKAKRLKEAIPPLPLRPLPPEELLEQKERFLPATGLSDWVMDTFVHENAPLFNPIHRHLRHARIGYLWTTVPNYSKMNRVIGYAEEAKPPGSVGRWAKARFEQQIRDWFGPHRLDFLITFDALYAVEAADLEWCAISEHEISHCGQKRNRRTGAFMFNRETGKPVFGLRGHDVEEFVHIVERYGPGASAGRTADLVAAGSRPPLIGAADIAGACGTCLRKAA